MKIKNNFVLRQIADVWIVMPIGDATLDFNGMLTLNDSGATLWRVLETGGTLESMVDALMEEYDVSREEATRDASEFFQKLVENGCVER